MEKDFSNELMGYIYNEMSPKEREDFEKQIASDPDLRKELEALRQIRGALGALKDKEVMEPVTISGPIGEHGKSRSGLSAFMKPLLAIAASITLLLLTGYVTNFSVQLNDSGFYLGFVEKPEVQDLNEAAVKALIRSEINKNNEVVMSSMEDAFSQQSEKYDAQFTSLHTELQSIGDTKSTPSSLTAEEDLRAYIEASQKNNIALLKQYLKLSNEQQQLYYQDLLTQFSNYVQEQREEDLLLIKSSLIALKENQDLQKQETDQRLASLYTNVHSQND
jgi:hypothetical protein